MSDHVTSDHLMPDHIISDHIISDCIMSNHIWSNHVMAYNNKIPHRMQMCDVPVCTAAGGCVLLPNSEPPAVLTHTTHSADE